MTTALRRLPSMWGVVALVALLVGLPWLPLRYEGELGATRGGSARLDSGTMRTPSRSSPRDDRFTVYVVSDFATADDVKSRVDPQRNMVALITNRYEEEQLSKYLLDANMARSQAQIPDISVIDLRTN